MRPLRLAATGLTAGAAAALALGVPRTVHAVRRGRRLAARAVPYRRECGSRTPALLVLGDSLAVGVGAAHPRDSVPGRLAALLPGLTVHNHARCGARADDLAAQLRAAPRARYDALLVAAGANDVMRGASMDRVGEAFTAFLREANARAEFVVVVTSANVGGAPMLPWYLRRLLTARSRRLRDVVARRCALAGAHFVDLFAEPAQDPFRRDPRRYFGVDGLHPSSESYRVCLQRICRGTPIVTHLAGRPGMRRARQEDIPREDTP